MKLSVILSDASVAAPAGTARFGVELTRALIDTATEHSVVSGYSHRLSPVARAGILHHLPGLHTLSESVLPRRLLGVAWDAGVASAPVGDVHLAPSLFAPIAARRAQKHSKLVVTIHDLVPYTHPQTLSPHGVRWHRRQITRAQRWADTIVVPSEAVAALLQHYAPAGERVRVVPGAASPSLLALARQTAVPVRGEPYVLFVGTLEPRKGLDILISAMAHPAMSTGSAAAARLIIAGASGWGGVDIARYAESAGLDPALVRVIGRVDDAELVSLIRGASAVVVPSRAEGFGLPVVEAMALGTPVIHSLDAALCETAGGAGLGVDLSGDEHLAHGRLAAAIARLLTETELSAQLTARGRQRAEQFSWSDSAQRVWQIVNE